MKGRIVFAVLCAATILRGQEVEKTPELSPATYLMNEFRHESESAGLEYADADAAKEVMDPDVHGSSLRYGHTAERSARWR